MNSDSAIARIQRSSVGVNEKRLAAAVVDSVHVSVPAYASTPQHMKLVCRCRLLSANRISHRAGDQSPTAVCHCQEECEQLLRLFFVLLRKVSCLANAFLFREVKAEQRPYASDSGTEA